MGKYFYRDIKLGIVGGGQLGRMLIQAAVDFNVHIEVLDPSKEAPCNALAHAFHQGSLTDYDTVYNFGKNLDVLTIEIENVNADALADLEKEGKHVFPKPATIKMIQDKRVQKQFLKDKGFPTSDFFLVRNVEEIRSHVDKFPIVYKMGKAGYDGKGVQILREEKDLDNTPEVPGLLEELVPIDKEISVIAARNPQGDISIFPLVEMVFHPVQNLVDYLISPARISPKQTGKAKGIARRVLEELDYVGLLVIEMFVDKEGEIWVNEMAPRPHNSGHQTIRSNITSQYEQHIRSILGLPLGTTRLLSQAAMVNMLGDDGYRGTAIYEGMESILQIPSVFPHIYGKAETRPFRKMGHITILGENREELEEKIKKIREKIRVIA